jgi:hypothetical protein
MSGLLHAAVALYFWLVEVVGAKPVEWVQALHATSASAVVAFLGFDPLVAHSLAFLHDLERIPYAPHIGD